MMATDLERAYKALSGKAATYKKRFAYYDGEQPLTYTSKRLEEIFRGLDAYFAENWCSVVIDAAKDRINLREIQIADAGAAEAWRMIWEASELALESDEVHESVMVAGEAFMIAWPDVDGEVQAYYNDPRLCHIFYDPEFPRVKRFASKWWVADDETMRMTLYYPDRLEYYATRSKAANVSSARAFAPMEPAEAENPYGEIPVFHFRLARKIKSDLGNVIPIQNGINKLFTDMMVTAEYLAFPQRYIISNAEVKGKVRNAPNEILDLPAGDGMSQQTQAGQFPAASLDNYLKAIDNLATTISSITRTPKHYFFSVGSNLSGEALIAMEAPLNKKAADRIDRFSPVWRRLAIFMLRASGHEVNMDQVMPVFDRPETVQPRTQAETREINVRAGIPLISVLREEGKSEAEIQAILKEKEAETRRQQASLAEALLDAERRQLEIEQNGLNGNNNAQPG